MEREVIAVDLGPTVLVGLGVEGIVIERINGTVGEGIAIDRDWTRRISVCRVRGEAVGG